MAIIEADAHSQRPYAAGRRIHDADAHVMETPGWIRSYADPDVRDRLPEGELDTLSPGEQHHIDELRAAFGTTEEQRAALGDLMGRKNWRAMGSFLAEHRTAALDALGFASQLVFNTFASKDLVIAEHSGDLDVAYGIARAHNRAMIEFCSTDVRSLPVCYTPLVDFDRTATLAREAIDAGAAAIMIPHTCPPGHSPSHLGLDPLWAQCQEAGVPVVLHVGGGGQLINPDYFVNGRPPVPDFHGGDGNFRSVDYLAIPFPVMQTLGVLVLDGVLRRFPNLKVGVIELGAAWYPGFLQMLESCFTAFRKNEERLQAMDLTPSEYCRRQIRVTPYPHEDAGWIIEQVGEESCLFSSDYPHVEGGRNPLGRFDRSLEKVSARARERFYFDNFVDLLGPVLERRGLPVD
ncbi:MAG: amidohydrolase family protein [Acidimicrobiales bacterium]